MNLFILDKDPIKAARLQCDKHVVKMIVESAQMLSTAHRMLDGTLEARPSVSGKTTIKYWKLPDNREEYLYKAVHTGHPCTVWTMENNQNYNWHLIHFIALCDEYTYRYGKVHSSEALKPYLCNMPNNIPVGTITPFALAMKSNPECMIKGDPVTSYRKFYNTKKARFKMTWTKRDIPEWFDPMTTEEKRALYPY